MLPSRADHVGSLLRPSELKNARANYAAGRIGAHELSQVEDRCISKAVRQQEALGLRAVTDGEFRRSWWHFDFLAALHGVDLIKGQKTIQFHGVETRAETVAVTGPVRFNEAHPMLGHFKYLAGQTRRIAKMTIPAPAVLHFRGGRPSISKRVYPRLDQFFEDTARAYRHAVAAFYAAGCRYLQFDDTVWAYLCSDVERSAALDRGDQPDSLAGIYCSMINEALVDKPADMIVTTHVCRGNFRSSWIAEGGYEPIAETLLAKTNYDGYFLEYDSDRAGDFRPLRFLPPGEKYIALGLITSKTPELEAAQDLLLRIEEASRFAPRDQLCLSPQCGFASTEEGNLLNEDEQWAKLALVTDVAKQAWPDEPGAQA